MLNRFYAWGAAFVILGALFKFLKWPYADVILFVSMMTEVIIFFVSGFEPYVEEEPYGDEAPLISPRREAEGSPSPLATETLRESHEAYAEEVQRLSESLANLQAEHQQMLRNMQELNQRYARMLEAMGQADKVQS